MTTAKPRTYDEAGLRWLRSIDGYEPPKPGEVAVRSDYIGVTDYLAADTFSEEAMEWGERWGGEFHLPEIIHHAA